jgi:uncharacterized protein YutE (UPF0331/DUF86 family)
MNDERASLVERLQAQAEDLLRETPTLFAYGITDPEGFPGLHDVQLAVYMDPALPSDSYFHVEIRLEALLEEALGLAVAGARILNGAPVNWQGAVLEAGRVVYSRDENARVSFEEKVRREYFDLKGLLAAHARPGREEAVAIRSEEVASGLQALDAHIARLRELGDLSSDDPTADAAARYYLQSAVTSCLSVCLHLAAALKLRPPRDLTDIPEVLAEVGVLTKELSGELVRLIAIRDHLVHDPVEEDPELVEGLPGHLAGLDRFAQAVRDRFKL